MSTTDLAARVVADSPRYEIDVNPGASAAALDAFEARYAVALAPDVRNFYAQIDGMDTWALWTEECLTRWASDRIKPIPEVLPEPHNAEYRAVGGAAHRFVIADLLVRCDLYAIHIPTTSVAACPVITVNSGQVVAAYFSDFVRQRRDTGGYLEDPAAVCEIATSPHITPTDGRSPQQEQWCRRWDLNPQGP